MIFTIKHLVELVARSLKNNHVIQIFRNFEAKIFILQIYPYCIFPIRRNVSHFFQLNIRQFG